jgi:hypothetical protein
VPSQDFPDLSGYLSAPKRIQTPWRTETVSFSGEDLAHFRPNFVDPAEIALLA